MIKPPLTLEFFSLLSTYNLISVEKKSAANRHEHL